MLQELLAPKPRYVLLHTLPAHGRSIVEFTSFEPLIDRGHEFEAACDLGSFLVYQGKKVNLLLNFFVKPERSGNPFGSLSASSEERR